MYPRDTENTTGLHYLNEEPQVFFVELKRSKKNKEKFKPPSFWINILENSDAHLIHRDN